MSVKLPTCILDFIEQGCEVSYKMSKQIVRYRLSKIARTAERVHLSPNLNLWLTYQNTFKNHENLPTCILDFIEQDCEVSYKISKQIVRYRLSKIAQTDEGVLLSPSLHLWLTYQNTFKNHEILPICSLDFVEQDCEV